MQKLGDRPRRVASCTPPLRRAAFAAALAMLVACGTDADLSVENYTDELHDAFCSFLSRCGTVEDIAACRDTNLGGQVFFLSPSVRAAIGEGTSEFRAKNARICLDALADRSCDVTSQSNRALPDECANIITGTLHEGAACALNAECISEICIVQQQCDQACCLGTCVGDTAPVSARLGESCELAGCDDTSFCDFTLTCVPLQPEGTLCSSPAQCDYGLDCLPTSTCGPLPALGEPCSGACRDLGTMCNPVSHTCVETALAGEDCTTSADCSPFYACDDTGHCNPGIALGGQCATTQLCAGDRAFCDAPSIEDIGTCSLPKPDGAACNRDAMCESFYCDLDALTCGPEPVCISG